MPEDDEEGRRVEKGKKRERTVSERVREREGVREIDEEGEGWRKRKRRRNKNMFKTTFFLAHCRANRTCYA